MTPRDTAATPRDNTTLVGVGNMGSQARKLSAIEEGSRGGTTRGSTWGRRRIGGSGATVGAGGWWRYQSTTPPPPRNSPKVKRKGSGPMLPRRDKALSIMRVSLFWNEKTAYRALR